MKIHHVAITVNNIDESSSFYSNFFNFKLIKKFARPDLNGKAVFLELDGFHLELWEFDDSKETNDDPKDIKIKGMRHLAFAVDDLNKKVTELRIKGLTVSAPKMGASGHRYAFMQDPNGVSLELYEV